MKKLSNFLLFFSLCLGGCYSSSQVSSNDSYSYQDGEVSYQTFYDQLQPYGNWIDYPGYGYVWQPNAGMDFRPYETNGHWVSTIDGWAWASDYSWGWAPFHYGRWLYEPAIGWAWIPGYEWAPAWVTWGQYDNYYAWAPLAPGINISIGSTWRAPYNYWSFIPRNYIQYSNPGRYIVQNNFNRNVVNNIMIINNYNSYDNRDYYHRGPDYREVEQYTHRAINPLPITPTQRPGAARISQRQFEVYRPAVSPNSVTNNRGLAPARVKTINEVTANSDIRRPRVGGDNSSGSTYNSGLDQNNTNTGAGNFRNRSLNGINGRYGNRDNSIGNAGDGVGNSSATDRVERIERFRQNNVRNNASESLPGAPQAQSDEGDQFGTQRMRRYGQIAQGNQQGNGEHVMTNGQQRTEMDEQFRKRMERTEQYRANNQNRNDDQNLNLGGFQNNRNIERSQNFPQPNNNTFRRQTMAPAAEQRAMPAPLPASERNTQQTQGVQNGPQRLYRRGQ